MSTECIESIWCVTSILCIQILPSQCVWGVLQLVGGICTTYTSESMEDNGALRACREFGTYDHTLIPECLACVASWGRLQSL